jgi:hypothetical protein
MSDSMYEGPQDVIDAIADINPEALTADGFEDCIAGIVSRFGMEPVVLYDRDACVRNLMARGLTSEEADEYLCFNVEGAWLGDGTPAFATLVRPTTK